MQNDASDVGISAVLLHVIEGKEKLVGCISRKLTNAERSYPTCHKEASSIIFGISKLYYYLCGGNKFTIRTDNKPLIATFGEHKSIPQYSANRLQRWAVFLSLFNYEIQHIKGTNNFIAEYFGRQTSK